MAGEILKIYKNHFIAKSPTEKDGYMICGVKYYFDSVEDVIGFIDSLGNSGVDITKYAKGKLVKNRKKDSYPYKVKEFEVKEPKTYRYLYIYGEYNPAKGETETDATMYGINHHVFGPNKEDAVYDETYCYKSFDSLKRVLDKWHSRSSCSRYFILPVDEAHREKGKES